MEAALLERDKVGVQDFVLLHDHLSLTEFLENLEKRFKHDLIYVSRLMSLPFDMMLCMAWSCCNVCQTSNCKISKALLDPLLRQDSMH